MRNVLVTLFVLLNIVTVIVACENPQADVVYDPPAVVSWSFDEAGAEQSGLIPVCGAGAETRWLDGSGSPTISRDLAVVVECRWPCAYYLTPDGRVGPRRYRKRWVHYSDGWAVQAGDFSWDCRERLLGGGAWDYEPTP